MSEVKHTPGPWTFKHTPGAGLGIFADVSKALGERYSKDSPLYHVSNDYCGLCISYELWTQFPREEWDSMQAANGRLMAAAPDMLAALIDVRRALEIANFTGELAVVDASIAKATTPT